MNGPVLTVKCIGCGEKKDLKPGDVPAGEMPMCDKCFNPMVAESAQSN